MPNISIYCEAAEAQPATVGVRILDVPKFIAYVTREIEETGVQQGFDGDEHYIIQLNPIGLEGLLSASYGLRSKLDEDYVMIGEQKLLRRSRANKVLAGYAMVKTREAYIQLCQDGEPILPFDHLPADATHILTGVSADDEGSLRGNPPWAMLVADEGAEY